MTENNNKNRQKPKFSRKCEKKVSKTNKPLAIL